MKTLTTLTAVTTIVAGISFAQAQGTMGKPGTSGSNMQAPQTTGTGAFCINTSPGGPLNCKYASSGSLRKGRQTAKSELFAKPEEEHNRVETVAPLRA